MADYAKNISFENCEIAAIGTNSFWFRNACSDISVTHCYLHDWGAGGVKIGDIVIPANESNLTKRIIIENNIIRYSVCSGVTLGKHGDEFDNKSQNSAVGYVETIKRGLAAGWSGAGRPAISHGGLRRPPRPDEPDR